MSDPVAAANPPTLEQRMDDVRAVMDAVGSQRAVVFGASEGGNMSMFFAATYPERTVALCTFGCTARAALDSGLPLGADLGGAAGSDRAAERDWAGGLAWEDIAPSLDREACPSCRGTTAAAPARAPPSP